MLKNLIHFFLIFSLFLLMACSRVTQENFDKIQTNMTMEQVVAILGNPSSSEGTNFLGVSATAATWKYKKAVITIIFLNNNVQIKSFASDGGSEGADF